MPKEGLNVYFSGVDRMSPVLTSLKDKTLALDMMVLALNIWLELGVWDYSAQWGNLWGQICPLYTILWCLLAGPVIVVFDWLDCWLCGGERPRYTFL